MKLESKKVVSAILSIAILSSVSVVSFAAETDAAVSSETVAEKVYVVQGNDNEQAETESIKSESETSESYSNSEEDSQEPAEPENLQDETESAEKVQLVKDKKVVVQGIFDGCSSWEDYKQIKESCYSAGKDCDIFTSGSQQYRSVTMKQKRTCNGKPEYRTIKYKDGCCY